MIVVVSEGGLTLGIADNPKDALIEAINLLGFDPTTIGPLCYRILSSDLKRRFQEQGYAKTFEQINRIKNLGDKHV